MTEEDEHLCHYTREVAILATKLVEREEENSRLLRQVRAGDYRRDRAMQNCTYYTDGLCGIDGMELCRMQCGDNFILVDHTKGVLVNIKKRKER